MASSKREENAANDFPINAASKMDKVLKLSTNQVPIEERQSWLREVICREYANVEVTSPTNAVLNQDLLITEWNQLRLSTIVSSEISLKRRPNEPYLDNQDNYFAIVLLSGQYSLEQDGKVVQLNPGDLTIYDATRPHTIICPKNFEKLILSIPRKELRGRIAGIDQCLAKPISGADGLGLIASNFLHTSSKQQEYLSSSDVEKLAVIGLDMLTLAINSIRPSHFQLSNNRLNILIRVKNFIEKHLNESSLDAQFISDGTGLSIRYLNSLFSDEDTSLMRYVWNRRLECCRLDLSSPALHGLTISEIAYHWGFNDVSHFSRAFKGKFGCAPRDYSKKS